MKLGLELAPFSWFNMAGRYMKQIKLTRGKYALVDDQDFEFLNSFSWYAHFAPHGRTYYAARKRRKNEAGKQGEWVSMHCELMKPTGGLHVDHIDQNGLNNQKVNLRLVTRAQNMRNVAVKKNSTSRIIGVTFEKQTGKYKAHITLNKKTITLGRFESISEASKVRKQAEEKYFV